MFFSAYLAPALITIRTQITTAESCVGHDSVEIWGAHARLLDEIPWRVVRYDRIFPNPADPFAAAAATG